MRFKRLSYLFFLLLFSAMSVFGQAVAHRRFDNEKLEKYKNSSDYQYGEKFRFSFPDWLNEMLEKIIRFLEDLFHIDALDQPGVSKGFPIILWTVAILAVVGLLYIIFRGKWTWLFSGKKYTKQEKEQEYSVYDEDIHSIDFTDEIELAIQQRNYRKATRLFYLRSLKLLSDADEIEWKINKTNTEYSREIKNKQRRADFDSLSLRFEYIWYGEFEVSEETYMDTFEKFRRFNQQFNSITA